MYLLYNFFDLCYPFLTGVAAPNTKERRNAMSKEEIALELAKLSFNSAIDKAVSDGEVPDGQKVVTDLYNYIYGNLKVSEGSK